MENLINDNLDPSSSDESDNGFDNKPDNDESSDQLAESYALLSTNKKCLCDSNLEMDFVREQLLSLFFEMHFLRRQFSITVLGNWLK